MQDPADLPLSSPSAPLLAHLRAQLQRWPPFTDMRQDDLDWFLAHARQAYFEPGEVLLSPAHGPVDRLFLVRQGTVRGHVGPADGGESFAVGAGELMPLSAMLAARAVRSTYTALDDVFVLELDAEEARQLARRSPVFADFLHGRMQALLERSRQDLRQELAAQALAQQAQQAPLGQLVSAQAVHCLPGTPLREALRTMQERHIGSMLVVDESGELRGIFTRQDLLARVLAPGFDLAAPIGEVMHTPVRCLTHEHSVQDAALLMGEHAIRHVPVTREGKVLGMVSEHDLFTMQRTSLQQVGARIRRAATPGEFRQAADDIRALARQLFAQGMQPHPLTELISRLNDSLTRHLLAVHAAQEGIELHRLCWLALGSEGRGEQTIATDQDNALVVPDDVDDAALERLRAWADGVNRALDACGYPLCRGGIMAGQPACCLRLSDWLARFGRWIDQGDPQDLLHASIFFDFRALAGDAAMADRLAQHIAERVRRTPRFLHQLAVNALGQRPALDWAGRVETDAEGRLDLKLQGTALFVDAARILALAQGVQATGTRERLLQGAQRQQLQRREYDSWIGAFEFLQGLRLRVQLAPTPPEAGAANRLVPAELSDIDRRILAASLREARRLQQHLEMTWAR